MAEVCGRTGQAGGVEAAVEVDKEEGVEVRRGEEVRDDGVEERLVSSISANSLAPVAASITTNDVLAFSLSLRNMGYPCHVFHASELPDQVQADLNGRKRKLDGDARKIDLAGCELFEMLQYKCEIKEPVRWDSAVQCYAVDRLFRKCKDRKGTFMVETTAWEGKDYSPTPEKKDDEKKPPKHYHWLSSWTQPDTAP
ncbi:hypothetical protein G7046_g7113 [Stylonectria norvegica]|nr:hypothetical protein G7046_g7113 [Stylonectria norvegica]